MFISITVLLCKLSISSSINGLNKRIDSQALEIKALQKQVQLLLQNTKVNSEYCELLPDDIWVHAYVEMTVDYWASITVTARTCNLNETV